MSTVKTQYNNYLRDNPESNYSYQEWLDNVFSVYLKTYENKQDDDISIWDITLMDGLDDEY